jgi:hypothetical protein
MACIDPGKMAGIQKYIEGAFYWRKLQSNGQVLAKLLRMGPPISASG